MASRTQVAIRRVLPASPFSKTAALKSSNQAMGTPASGQSAPSLLGHPRMVVHRKNVRRSSPPLETSA